MKQNGLTHTSDRFCMEQTEATLCTLQAYIRLDVLRVF